MTETGKIAYTWLKNIYHIDRDNIELERSISYTNGESISFTITQNKKSPILLRT